MRRNFNLIANVYAANEDSNAVQLANALKEARFCGKLSFATSDGVFRLTENNGNVNAFWEMEDSNLSVHFFDSERLVTNGFIEDMCSMLLGVIRDSQVFD